ncbi:MAG TPA: hypothetical protein DCP31_15255, partial [Cyanobacteria bacterium UBA8543]|nr:hypothetical protein [Cyanobacteria bacterium UBA8543]
TPDSRLPILRLGIVGALSISGAFTYSNNSALAQVTPDSTLGTERSVVVPNQVIKGIPSDQINGGATRGTNLFHSFQEFNVGEGQGVYFTNPAGIENILSRVTGGNPSNIFGRLGVLGNANLFLLNPNGIMFGPNSSLDIKGSFFATTANGIKLGDTGFFSASEPQNSRLISVSPGALFFNQVANQPATITNSGNLAVGQNFTISADNLDLQGQLYAGKDLTLQAQNTVKARDSAASPFIASAGGQLLIEGNQGVDIFALNHPSSGLFSGGDMVLRSPSPVLGDARYTTGGNFRIEQRDRSLGNLISPFDPIIQASGNVSFTSYTGRSLHILAGGSVNIDSITITGSDPTNSINETVTLSNGTPLTINGSTRPTLDVRAGTTAVTSPSGVQGTPSPTGLSLTNTPTSADITIGNITVSAADGLVFLTNQYQPNTALTGGVIQVGKIDTSRRLTGKGGDVVIDSRNRIALSDTLNTSSLLGNGGNVTLLAAGDINPANINSVGLLGGNVTLTSNETISFSDRFVLTASITPSASAADSKGGDINVNARSLSLTNGARLIAATLGTATGGDINVRTSQSIALSGNDNGLRSDASTIPQFTDFLATLPQNALNALDRITGSGLLAVTVQKGTGGNVTVDTGQLSVRDGSEISAYAYNQGNGGNLTINASESVELIGTSPENYAGGAYALTYAAGNSGNTTINTKRLIVRDGSAVSASNLLGTGNGGNLTVNASELVELSGTSPDGTVPSNLSAGSAGERGDSGDLLIKTNRLIVKDGAALATATTGRGQGGNLTINASDVELSGVSAAGINPTILTTDTFGQTLDAGNAGELTINTQRLIVRDGAVVSASTWGPGKGGTLKINALESVQLSGGPANGLPSGLYAQGFGAGNAGDLEVNTPALSLQNGARITVATTDASTDLSFASGRLIVGVVPITFPDQATGNAGQMTINTDSIQLNNGSLTASSIRAGGGNITTTANDIELRNNSLISTSVANSTGGGGDIEINSDTFLALEDSDILANADQGPGGNITIKSPVFLADLFSSGKATAVGRNPGDFAQFRGNGRVDISASSRVGISGNVSVPDFTFLQNSLTALSGNFVNPEQAIAYSCLSRRNAERGSFTVTGTGGLPRTPYEAMRGQYQVSEVQGLTPQTSSPRTNPQTPNSQKWKLGDPVQEAQGMTATADGRILVGTSSQLAPVNAEDLICHETEIPLESKPEVKQESQLKPAG